MWRPRRQYQNALSAEAVKFRIEHRRIIQRRRTKRRFDRLPGCSNSIPICSNRISVCSAPRTHMLGSAYGYARTAYPFARHHISVCSDRTPICSDRIHRCPTPHTHVPDTAYPTHMHRIPYAYAPHAHMYMHRIAYAMQRIAYAMHRIAYALGAYPYDRRTSERLCLCMNMMSTAYQMLFTA